LADENFPRPALKALRDAGQDVAWIADSHSGATDIEVLKLCMAQRRVLLTFDKDFGELAFIKGCQQNVASSCSGSLRRTQRRLQ
jgi:predicted nuclease of predicted toxin-antitoxin system